MSDLQHKSSQKYFTVFQFLNPNGITKNNRQVIDFNHLPKLYIKYVT